jgi:23S rRNA (cytidine1920-2'-O)/16S rRNA (cytidine1409-2'-O)-methyltransferase
MNIESSLDNKNRLDVEVESRGLARSRSNASDLIKRGNVKVNGNVKEKPSFMVSSTDVIEMVLAERFVSRAGEKLEKALEEFQIDVEGVEAIDIGSSTGGFTDCLLKRGAKKVIALDVGTNQLVEELRNNPAVEVHEGTNVRTFKLPSQVKLAVVDVSFISLKLVLPKAYEFLKRGGTCVALVKPQFEVGMEMAKKFEGVITDDKLQKKMLISVKGVAKRIGFKVVASIPSPIEGEKGNKEFLLYLKK